MADITLTGKNGVPYAATAGDVFFPYIGNWTCHLVLADNPDPLPSGQVTVNYHGLSLSGYVLRAGVFESTCYVMVVGGKGGLWKVLPSKYYANQTSVRLPLDEIVQGAGETLSTSSTPSILSATLSAWPRRQDEAGNLLSVLADSAKGLWRVKTDGTVFFGADTFQPPQNYDNGDDYTLIRTEPEFLMQTVAPLGEPAIFPGMSWLLGNVGRVHYEDDGDEFLMRVWYLSQDQKDDAVVAGLRYLIDEEIRGTAYYPTFGGKVVQQRGDGTIDITLDDRRLPPLTSVPVLVPVPGAKLTVDAGSRAYVSFAGGDPTRPLAQLYESGNATKEVVLTDDEVNSGTIAFVVTPAVPPGPNGTLAITYTDPFGSVQNISLTVTGLAGSSGTFRLKGKPRGTAKIKLPGS